MATLVETPDLRSAQHLRSVTPNDTTDIRLTASDGKRVECRGLYVSGAGDLALLACGDSAPITLAAIPAGTFVPVAVRRVYSTNTTATGIVAMY